MIELLHVSKTFNRRSAVKDVSFTLPVGKIVGIVGENGSGKSTLLQLMAGLLQPTGGSVTVLGERADRRSGKRISYLSDQGGFYSMFTIKEALAFQASQFPDFNRAKAEDMIAFMQLEPQRNISELSRGHRGRLSIALTLARDVPYIFMDEPLSGLDPMVRQSIVKGMLAYLDLGAQTLVMTSHEIAEIEPILDSFIAMRDGCVIKITDVEALHEAVGLGIAEWMKKTYV